MNDTFPPRDRAYFDLLHRGLVLLRNIAHSGNVDLCRVEAEHLHEMPTLIGEGNESRHEYYLRATRERYLQQLRELQATDYLEQVAIWYEGPWQVLDSVAVPIRRNAKSS